jgi:hypothetical protein
MVSGSSCLQPVKAMVLLLITIVIVPEGRPATDPVSGEMQTPKKDQKAEQKENADTAKRPPVQPQGKATPPGRLNLKYRILKRASDGHAEETSPDSTFLRDDRIQLRVTPSRSGYLYIIQSEEDKDGELIFPHSRIGGGQNRLTSTREHVIPGLDCDKQFRDEQNVCWLPIRSAKGRVWITVYFSPSQTDRPFAIQSGGKVSRQEIVTLRSSASNASEFGNYGRQVFAGRNSRGVAARVDLNHEVPPAADPAVQPKRTGASNADGSSGSGSPGGGVATNPATVAKPAPSALWGKLETEFDNSQGHGVRATLLKVTENGRVATSPADGFKLADRLNLDFYCNFDAYAYIVHVTPNGAATVVFPDGAESRKIKANFRSVAAMKRLVLNEKGIHTLQLVVSGNRVNVLEEALKKKSGQLNQVTAIAQQSREPGFDCASPLTVFQAERRAVALAGDASSNQASAIALVLSSQSGVASDLCRNFTPDQFKGDKIKGQEIGLFEIRFKQL